MLFSNQLPALPARLAAALLPLYTGFPFCFISTCFGVFIPKVSATLSIPSYLFFEALDCLIASFKFVLAVAIADASPLCTASPYACCSDSTSSSSFFIASLAALKLAEVTPSLLASLAPW